MYFEAELVVPDLAEDIAVALRNKVIGLINSAIAGQGENTLFGEKVVEFELAQLHVEPGAAEHIVKPAHDRFKVKRMPVLSDEGST